MTRKRKVSDAKAAEDPTVARTAVAFARAMAAKHPTAFFATRERELLEEFLVALDQRSVT